MEHLNLSWNLSGLKLDLSMSLKWSMLPKHIAQPYFSALEYSSFTKLYHSWGTSNYGLDCRWSRAEPKMFAGRSILSCATPNSPWPTVKWYRIRQDWWPGKTEHLVNHLRLQDVHRDGLMTITISDTLTENWGVCWQLCFSSLKIPLGFWPSLNRCQRSVTH